MRPPTLRERKHRGAQHDDAVPLSGAHPGRVSYRPPRVVRPVSLATKRAGTWLGPTVTPHAKLSKYSSLLAGTGEFCAARSTKVPSGASNTNLAVGS